MKNVSAKEMVDMINNAEITRELGSFDKDFGSIIQRVKISAINVFAEYGLRIPNGKVDDDAEFVFDTSFDCPVLETDYKIIDNDGDVMSGVEFCREYGDSLNICQERYWNIDDWKEIVVPILK